MAYALGKYAQAICDRCGFQYPYLDLREEWNNFKVCPECYEPKARQLEPTQTGADAEALFQPRPDVQEPDNITISFPVTNTDTFSKGPIILALQGRVGTVTLGGDVITPVGITGVSASASIGSVTIAGVNIGPTFDSTSVTLDATSKTFDEV